MKRVIAVTLVAASAFVLWGCPIYSDSNRVCNDDGSCYTCPSNTYDANNCSTWTCYSNSDCPSNESCYSDGVCRGTGTTTGTTGTSCSTPSDCPSGDTCGADQICHTGDCSTVGCPSSYVCKLSGGTGTPECVAVGGTDGGAGSDGGSLQCSQNTDCASVGSGDACLDGTCVAPADQCTDATQCPNSEQCVQGACTPACDANTPCPDGYSCDLQKGVCTGNPTPCTTSQSCSGGDVCVEDHCVDPCGAGNTCPTGDVCVGGGCIPDQKPQFVCNVEGTQDSCNAGSICLRHNCYIACDPEASTSCQSADEFNVCKQVTDQGNSYYVCGSNSNLGNECDVSAGQNCATPLICIDGYCR